jgi:hypothetical protein
MSERKSIQFRYRKGQLVTWAEDHGKAQVIVGRRWTEREVLGPIHEYLVHRADNSRHQCYWAIEADLLAPED